MNFLSDTTAPAHPAILDALGRANEGFAPSYGADPVSARVKAQLCELFETDLDVVFTTSGTASNALALSVLCPPDSMVLCHDEAHIHRDERGAPEFFTKGGKLLPNILQALSHNATTPIQHLRKVCACVPGRREEASLPPSLSLSLSHR